MDNKQEIWDEAKKYGEIFYQRATGQLPEMESSKAVMKILRDIINDNDTLVDMGCGGGHYLLSIAKNINKNFDYIGLDRTANYLELAKGLGKTNKVLTILIASVSNKETYTTFH